MHKDIEEMQRGDSKQRKWTKTNHRRHGGNGARRRGQKITRDSAIL